ncbi:hypothetical protein HPP92_010608 [Vanilla planifolia]|uniref:Uncharacterized protein n=1 Tax=Vanilla planifolia TaxID=51239 RepID=A0A835R185_VANPL|nr:hypothetical protein HPP92_010608 [Vanilla planifolia]
MDAKEPYDQWEGTLGRDEEFKASVFKGDGIDGVRRDNLKCTACGKTVYLVDQLVADNRFFHKFCFPLSPLQ